jgi:sec-independent protein translocase protein TatB
MEVFGIGPLELLLIILLAIIILGPKDMQKVGKNIGQALNKLVKSDTWKTVRQASERMKTLPTELMREAEMDEIQKSFKASLDEAKKMGPSSEADNQTIAPPTLKPPAEKPPE